MIPNENAVPSENIFPNEVVTKALLRSVARTRAGPAGRADHARQRLRPHQAEHVRPGRSGQPRRGRSPPRSPADPAFIAVTGKPYIFCVGADVTGMPLITSREQALEIGRLGHRVFGRLKDCSVPTFAFVNGAAMGGGLELALHCHYRTVSSGAAALALPEVSLGLVPGWGGTQLLPNLIGVIARGQGDRREPVDAEQDAEAGRGARDGHRSTPSSSRPISWSARWRGPPPWSRARSTVQRAEVDRATCGTRVLGFARKTLDDRLHGAPAGPVPGAEPAADSRRTRDFADRHRRRGRGARRPGHVRPVARWSVRVRPGTAASQASRPAPRHRR